MSDIRQRLDLRQGQNLVMTPQLQQAIKLLQMTNVELAEYVEEELAQNPLLEKDSGADEGTTEQQDAPAPETDDMQKEFDEGWTGNEDGSRAQDQAMPDFDPGSSMASVGAGGGTSFDDPERSLENTLTNDKTLRDHLQEQLNVAFDDTRDRMIGALLIDMIDESGYLRQGAQELSERLGIKPERMDRILNKLRQFDPPGIFARDLRDCLALQLQEQGRLDAPMKTLLDNLALLAGRDHKKLADLCGVNETYLKDMIGEIKSLNPKPAGVFDHMVVQTAIPDVLMKRLPKTMGGGWRVELNHETLPRVLVNQEYYTQVLNKAAGKQDKEYLNTQLQSAHWLVRAMDQRAKTILKVASEIIEAQDGFFLYGVEFLKPLTLKDIAEKIAMHESTVSRVTTNKYIGTPRGIFELKYFFTTALGDGDNAHSAEAVRAKIKNLIDAEKADDILSDDTIVDKLKSEGIDIARRTIAKYREEMGIGSSVQRRRDKNQK